MFGVVQTTKLFTVGGVSVVVVNFRAVNITVYNQGVGFHFTVKQIITILSKCACVFFQDMIQQTRESTMSIRINESFLIPTHRFLQSEGELSMSVKTEKKRQQP